jgi:hypothetical protein
MKPPISSAVHVFAGVVKLLSGPVQLLLPQEEMVKVLLEQLMRWLVPMGVCWQPPGYSQVQSHSVTELQLPPGGAGAGGGGHRTSWEYSSPVGAGGGAKAVAEQKNCRLKSGMTPLAVHSPSWVTRVEAGMPLHPGWSHSLVVIVPLVRSHLEGNRGVGRGRLRRG